MYKTNKQDDDDDNDDKKATLTTTCSSKQYMRTNSNIPAKKDTDTTVERMTRIVVSGE